MYTEYYEYCYFKWASIYNEINVYTNVNIQKIKIIIYFFFKFYHGDLFCVTVVQMIPRFVDQTYD